MIIRSILFITVVFFAGCSADRVTYESRRSRNTQTVETQAPVSGGTRSQPREARRRRISESSEETVESEVILVE